MRIWLPSVSVLDRDKQTIVLSVNETPAEVLRSGLRLVVVDEPPVQPGLIVVNPISLEEFAELVQHAISTGTPVQFYVKDERVLEALTMFLPVVPVNTQGRLVLGHRELLVLVRPKSSRVEPRSLEYLLLYYIALEV